MLTDNYKLSLRGILALTWWPIFWVTLYSTTLYILSDYLKVLQLDIPFSVSTILGLTISLILGFKTNSAYERWWEARIIWGAIVNDSRTWVRQLLSFVDKDSHYVKLLANYQIAWCHALRVSLRKQNDWSEVTPYLPKGTEDEVLKSKNVPNAILAEMGMVIKEMRNKELIDVFRFVSLDNTLVRLCDSMGKCERIKNTVFPKQYLILSRWSIIIFMIMLPYGMLDDIGIFIIPVSAIVMFFFTLPESIAISLKDPFENKVTDIPLHSISNTIEINLLEMLKEDKIPEKVEPTKDGVLM